MSQPVPIRFRVDSRALAKDYLPSVRQLRKRFQTRSANGASATKLCLASTRRRLGHPLVRAACRSYDGPELGISSIVTVR